MDPLDVLAQSELFSGATRADLEPLARSARLRSYRRGDPLWAAGDPADRMYLLLAGEVAVSRLGPDGEEYLSHHHVAGDVMGQLHFFEPAPTRSLDARASEPTECWIVPRRDLLQLLDRNPKLMSLMLRTYSRWIVQRDLQAADAAFRNLTSRVATRLLQLADRHGESTQGEVRIRLRLTETALANMLGASRENVSRSLAHLQRSGDVHREGGFLVLRNPDAIRERYSWVSADELRLIGR